MIMVEVFGCFPFGKMNVLASRYRNSRASGYTQFMIMIKKEIGADKDRMNMAAPFRYFLTGDASKTMVMGYAAGDHNTAGKFVIMRLDGFHFRR